MKELARRIRELDAQLKACNRCGTCHAHCPLYIQTTREADVARGKIALLDGLARQLFTDPEGVRTRLDHCLLCGACTARCPAGVNTLEIFLKARAILTEFTHLSLPEKIILRGLLSRPRLFDRLIQYLSVLQPGLFKKKKGPAEVIHVRAFSPVLRQRHFTPLAAHPFHRRRKPDQPSSGPGVKAAFFTGCLIDKLFPQVADAALAVFDYHRIEVFIPDNQGCCGMPSLSAGDLNSFNRLVEHNLQMLSADDFDFLVTACPTCTFTIQQLWPLFTETGKSDPDHPLHQMSAKTMDISQFVVEHLLTEKSRVTINSHAAVTGYHDPCHLKGSLKVTAEPRMLINQNPDYRLVEIADADMCCGLGGSFNLKHYRTSLDIGRRKMEPIAASHCEVIATGCPACMIQLTDLISRTPKEIVVKHVIEVYAETCKDGTARVNDHP
jgi:glycolate oxidase iron-sulfur subunit